MPLFYICSALAIAALVCSIINLCKRLKGKNPSKKTLLVAIAVPVVIFLDIALYAVFQPAANEPIALVGIALCVIGAIGVFVVRKMSNKSQPKYKIAVALTSAILIVGMFMMLYFGLMPETDAFITSR